MTCVKAGQRYRLLDKAEVPARTVMWLPAVSNGRREGRLSRSNRLPRERLAPRRICYPPNGRSKESTAALTAYRGLGWPGLTPKRRTNR